MKKHITTALAILSMMSLASCTGETAVLDEIKTYELTSDIHSLDVEINAADFTIEQSEEFSVESNLKNLSVSEKNGVLTIVDETKYSDDYYKDATLKLYIPKNITFKVADIKTGAGKLSANTFSADDFKLKAGAGQVEFDHLEILTDTSIQGGAGAISINDGVLNNLGLDLGAGKLDLTAQLLGESDLSFGVGKYDLTLIGDKDDYTLDVTNGVGKINIDGVSASASASINSGNGENIVKIKGGIGETNIRFE